MVKPITKIYSFHYKPDSKAIEKPQYINIWAGKNNSEYDNEFIGDDTGENISSKNKYYSELSGLYWIWKNTSQDIVGSCHYRRFFTTKKEPLINRARRMLYYPIGIWGKRHGLIYTKNYKKWIPYVLTTKEAEELLKKYDAILPVRRILKYDIETHYCRYHEIDDLNRIKSILKSSYPDYLNSFDDVLKSNRLFANNMFILREDLFKELMSWLFDILFTFEKQVDINEYNGYQQRIFGFLSERLITLWIAHNNIKYKELPLIYFKKLKQYK